MVVINEIELKKRAEHNYGRLFDLEEVSLHPGLSTLSLAEISYSTDLSIHPILQLN